MSNIYDFIFLHKNKIIECVKKFDKIFKDIKYF